MGFKQFTSRLLGRLSGSQRRADYETLRNSIATLDKSTDDEFARFRSEVDTFKIKIESALDAVRENAARFRDETARELDRLNTTITSLNTTGLPTLAQQVSRIEDRASAERSHLGSEISWLRNEVSQLHTVTVQELARLDRDLSCLSPIGMPAPVHQASRPENRSGAEALPLTSEVGRLSSEVSQMHEVVFQQVGTLNQEQHLLHSRVMGLMTPQLELLNRQLYELKRCLYHPGLSVVPDAFNGQFSKHRIFADLLAAFSFDALIETGANLGSTTHFLSLWGKPVHAVEIDPGLYEEAAERLRNRKDVVLQLGNSCDFLRNLTNGPLSGKELAFFYLDAHWYSHLPLREELSILATRHPNAVVMIDDFKVEDDPGYGYDSYGDGQEITLAYIEDEMRGHPWRLFYPALPSVQDHMTTDILPPRGTAIMSCLPEITAKLQGLRSLRPWPAPRATGSPG